MVDVQWAFISIVTTSLAHFILRIILGKELGAEGLGLYTLAFTIYLFGMQFAAFGIGVALTKYVAEFIEDVSSIRNYVSSGMSSSIITGTIMGVLLYFLAPYIAISLFDAPELALYIKLAAVCYPFIAIQKAVLGTLNGFRKMHLFALLNIIQNFLAVVVSITLVLLFGMGVFGAVIGFVAPTVLIGILCPVLIRQWIGFDASLWNVSIIWQTTVFGLYIVLGNSVAFLNTQVDSILIGYYLNPTEVGIYAVAVLLAQTLTLIPNAVQQVTGPVITRLYAKGDLIGVRKIVFSTVKRSFLVSVAMAGLIGIFGKLLITLLFTAEFLLAYIPLLILLVGKSLYTPIMAVGFTLAGIGKVTVRFYIAAACGVLNILLNIFLIPSAGITGAAIATTIALIVNCGVTMTAINHYLQIRTI